MALCSLNWGDIYYPYCKDLPGAAPIHVWIMECYRQAAAFIAPVPSMPMPALRNVVAVGPIARLGRRCRGQLNRQLGIASTHRLVTVFMGGVPTDLPLAHWPLTAELTWLISGSACPERPDMIDLAKLERPYLDVASSSDALITKPGYGGIAEAACNGIPVLSVPRGRWPEAPYLLQWLAAHGRCLELERNALITGRIAERLEELWALPVRPPVAPAGVAQATRLLEARLRPR